MLHTGSKGIVFNKLSEFQSIPIVRDNRHENSNPVSAKLDRSNPFIGYFTHSNGPMPISKCPQPSFISSLSLQAVRSITQPIAQQVVFKDPAQSATRYQNEFIPIKQLGAGGQGSVFMARSVVDNRCYAIKKVFLPETGYQQCLREVLAMARISPHPNVVRYHTAWIDAAEDIDFENELEDSVSSVLCIQMELCASRYSKKVENLAEWIKQHAKESYQDGLRLFLKIVKGIEHIHSFGILHRDLKPANIFIMDGVPKIGDFGLATCAHPSAFQSNQACEMDYSAIEIDQALKEKHTTKLGTYCYASPEQLETGVSHCQERSNYTEMTDIYSLGMILIELCCSFDTQMERAQVLTAARHGILPQVQDNRISVLIQDMLSVDPSLRPSTSDIIERIEAILNVLNKASIAIQLELEAMHHKLATVATKIRERSPATIELQILLSKLSETVSNLGNEHISNI